MCVLNRGFSTCVERVCMYDAMNGKSLSASQDPGSSGLSTAAISVDFFVQRTTLYTLVYMLCKFIVPL